MVIFNKQRAPEGLNEKDMERWRQIHLAYLSDPQVVAAVRSKRVVRAALVIFFAVAATVLVLASCNTRSASSAEYSHGRAGDQGLPQKNVLSMAWKRSVAERAARLSPRSEKASALAAEIVTMLPAKRALALWNAGDIQLLRACVGALGLAGDSPERRLWLEKIYTHEEESIRSLSRWWLNQWDPSRAPPPVEDG